MSETLHTVLIEDNSFYITTCFFNTNISNLSNAGECIFFFHHELHEY